MNLQPMLAALLGIVLLVAAPAAAAEPKAEDDAAAPAPKAVLLGRFAIRDFRATEGVKIRLNFALYTEVDEDNADRITQLVEKRKHRIRNQVLTAVRTAEQAEFQQPGLGKLRRRLSVRLHRTEPLLPADDLLIGEFEFFAD